MLDEMYKNEWKCGGQQLNIPSLTDARRHGNSSVLQTCWVSLTCRKYPQASAMAMMMREEGLRLNTYELLS